MALCYLGGVLVRLTSKPPPVNTVNKKLMIFLSFVLPLLPWLSTNMGIDGNVDVLMVRVALIDGCIVTVWDADVNGWVG